MRQSETYQGVEQGPIRPPSEAYSLLIRVTRNCPWNHCTFCPVYKGESFSIRPTEHVIKDIDTIYTYVETLHQAADESGQITRAEIKKVAKNIEPGNRQSLNAAVRWIQDGMRSVFIQDANSLIIKPSEMIDILKHLKKRFPDVERITSYARSHTIARISDENLKAMAHAGLNRIHIGLESGSDMVLKITRKGVEKETHIKAGIKVKNAGMELSEYFMPGLGGRILSKDHALETADALNRINPDFIRLRTLAIPGNTPLYDEYVSGRFEKCTDLMIIEEILLFLESLDGITSIIKSDHILNLFQEIEGRLPDDKEQMTGIIKTFLAMDKEQQVLYQAGRRLGIFSCLKDMQNRHLLLNAADACRRYGITPESADETISELMRRFI